MEIIQIYLKYRKVKTTTTTKIKVVILFKEIVGSLVPQNGPDIHSGPDTLLQSHPFSCDTELIAFFCKLLPLNGFCKVDLTYLGNFESIEKYVPGMAK